MLKYTLRNKLVEKGVVTKAKADNVATEIETDRKMLKRRLKYNKRYKKPVIVDLEEQTKRLFLQLELEK